MKRKVYSKMLDWKARWNGKAALLISGTPGVGKTWLAEEFARKEYKSHILIDFSKAPKEVKDLFQHDLHNLDAFFLKLSVFYNTPLFLRESVIIFDEVQRFPRARGAIKYLVEDGRFDFIETGSLINWERNVRDILIPSEEIRLDLFPLDLEEFLWEMDEDIIAGYAQKQFLEKQPMGAALHKKMTDLFRLYLVVGGMPEAITALREKKDLLAVDAVKRSILDRYRKIIEQEGGRQARSVSLLFENIPVLLQQKEKRFRPNKIKHGSKSRDFSGTMLWFEESGMVNIACNVEYFSGARLLLDSRSKRKTYFGDTGLLLSLAFEKEELVTEEIHRRILFDNPDFDNGMLLENFAAQMIKANGHPLCFYSNASRSDASARMEIDFLIGETSLTGLRRTVPIETASSNRISLASLKKFQQNFSEACGKPVVLHSKDLEEKDGVIFFPLYMAAFL